MKHDNTTTDANANQQRPKLKVAFYCRVATAEQLEEPKAKKPMPGLDVPAPVYRPEEIIRKNLSMELNGDTIRPVFRLDAILRNSSK
jgi:hypothetical protein